MENGAKASPGMEMCIYLLNATSFQLSKAELRYKDDKQEDVFDDLIVPLSQQGPLQCLC